LGIPEAARVVVYPGNTHPANIAEVRSLYVAIEALIRDGIDLYFVRLGQDGEQLPERGLDRLRSRIVRVPSRPRIAVPEHLALADVLVQPGRRDHFNEYRFPSKLPEFFAMGRPVILPGANIGRYVADGDEAIVLKNGDSLEIAAAMKTILNDPGLSAQLARGARRFYEAKFSWLEAGRKLFEFYDSLDKGVRLNRLGHAIALERVAKHYASYKMTEPLSYATVCDYSDSMDWLHSLATINRDLKDAQRPWVFKAILGSVPRGGQLLEIGAGDPWVADLLSRLGYQVYIVDPYDGRDRGPRQFGQIQHQYPGITFLRGLFPEALSKLGDIRFDCIYSISVLEHIPLDGISAVMAGIVKYSRTPLNPTIHAIDHVLLGEGDTQHHAHLREILRCLGFPDHALEEMLERLRCDPDAYFLSAEAHNLWRGTTPYKSFPMRRCISAQICCAAAGLMAL
jgi:hypothetical protein